MVPHLLERWESIFFLLNLDHMDKQQDKTVFGHGTDRDLRVKVILLFVHVLLHDDQKLCAFSRGLDQAADLLKQGDLVSGFRQILAVFDHY